MLLICKLRWYIFYNKAAGFCFGFEFIFSGSELPHEDEADSFWRAISLILFYLNLYSCWPLLYMRVALSDAHWEMHFSSKILVSTVVITANIFFTKKSQCISAASLVWHLFMDDTFFFKSCESEDRHPSRYFQHTKQFQFKSSTSVINIWVLYHRSGYDCFCKSEKYWRTQTEQGNQNISLYTHHVALMCDNQRDLLKAEIHRDFMPVQ